MVFHDHRAEKWVFLCRFSLNNSCKCFLNIFCSLCCSNHSSADYFYLQIDNLSKCTELILNIMLKLTRFGLSFILNTISSSMFIFIERITAYFIKSILHIAHKIKTYVISEHVSPIIYETSSLTKMNEKKTSGFTFPLAEVAKLNSQFAVKFNPIEEEIVRIY